jgi:cyclase
MLEKRLIPVLLIQNRKLVKSIKFGNYNYLGDPINAVKIFSTKTVNELVIIDVEASRKDYIDKEYLNQLADECFIPLTYCGGVKNLKDMEQIYKIGFEKIALDSIIFKDKFFLKEAIKEFGGSSVVVSLTVKKNFLGNYKLYNYLERKNRIEDLTDFVMTIQDTEPGEIFLNNVSYDGMMNGYDKALIEKISSKIQVPFTVCGGAGEVADAIDILNYKEVTGAAAGSIFVYSSRNKGIMINYSQNKNE